MNSGYRERRGGGLGKVRKVRSHLPKSPRIEVRPPGALLLGRRRMLSSLMSLWMTASQLGRGLSGARMP